MKKEQKILLQFSKREGRLCVDVQDVLLGLLLRGEKNVVASMRAAVAEAC